MIPIILICNPDYFTIVIGTMSETLKTVEQLQTGLKDYCSLCLPLFACMNLNNHRLIVKGADVSSVPQPIQQCKAYRTKNGFK